MLVNRRHLRIKVFHGLYAYFSDENPDIIKHQKSLIKSVHSMYDLYVQLLSVFDKLHQTAINRVEDGKKKRLPSEEDLNPNMKFIENKALNFFTINNELNKYLEKSKLKWTDSEETFKTIFNEIRESEDFQNYMASEESSLEEDKKILVSIFKKHIANNEIIQHQIEEKDIFWADDLDLVSSMVLKTIKMMDKDWDEYTQLPGLFKDEEDETEFFKILFRKTIVHSDEFGDTIAKNATNWESDRIAMLDLILMKMALTEAVEFKSIPIKVSMNEYIDLSKYYSTPKSSVFINGILDKAFKELKEEGKIKKVGRGLMQ